jgi:hypothetical protein
MHFMRLPSTPAVTGSAIQRRRLEKELSVDAIQCAVTVPLIEIVVKRASGRQLLRNGTPPATS